MTDEWIIGKKIPHIQGGVFQICDAAGAVRECARRPNVDWNTLWFTDCTNPAQNSICDESKIMAWRLKTVGASIQVAIEKSL